MSGPYHLSRAQSPQTPLCGKAVQWADMFFVEGAQWKVTPDTRELVAPNVGICVNCLVRCGAKIPQVWPTAGEYTPDDTER